MSEMNREEIETAKRNGTLDERCTCGHLKSHHHDTLVPGHGACRSHRTCGCKQFTWKEFVVVQKVEEAEA